METLREVKNSRSDRPEDAGGRVCGERCPASDSCGLPVPSAPLDSQAQDVRDCRDADLPGQGRGETHETSIHGPEKEQEGRPVLVRHNLDGFFLPAAERFAFFFTGK